MCWPLVSEVELRTLAVVGRVLLIEVIARAYWHLGQLVWLVVVAVVWWGGWQRWR